MDVSIKSFDVAMQVKTKGIEFQVYENDGAFRGDLILSKSGLTWCEGRTRRANGRKATWNEFVDWMNSDN